jgi:hypothetical protein
MPPPDSDDLRELVRRRAEIWRQAEPELCAVRIRDAAAIGVPEAIRQLFTGMEHLLFLPSPPTSGLIEQQAWFSRIREAAGSPGDPRLSNE